jgi:hypothetical protein
MTPNVMSKMFYEFENGSQSHFVNRIQEKRLQDSNLEKNIQISSKVSTNSSDIYINYKKNNRQIMHFSIHMCPENISTDAGPTHAKQNTSKDKQGISIHVYRDPNSPSGIRVELGSDFGKSMNASYREEAKIVAESLNDFFNEAAQNASQKPLHKNAHRIHQNIQTTLRKHNKTQRRKYRRASSKRI